MSPSYSKNLQHVNHFYFLCGASRLHIVPISVCVCVYCIYRWCSCILPKMQYEMEVNSMLQVKVILYLWE